MTVTTNTNKVQALGNGVTKTFPYSFRIYSASELVVTRTNLDTNVDTALVLNTDYTVTGAGSYNGGNVVLTGDAPSSTTRITIRRVVPVTQGTDLRNQGAYFAETHEDAFDKLTMIAQQQQEAIDRSLTLPPTASGVSVTLPIPEANNILAWNAAGTALENHGPVDNSILATALAAAEGVSLVGNAADMRDFAASSGASVIGFIHSETGSVARNVQAKLRETVSVKDFGAVGDGVTNDTVAIQAAMDSGAGCIRFPAGSYLFSQVIVPATVHALIGDGVGETVLTCTGAIADYQPWMYFNAITGIEVSGFTVSQNKVTYALNHAMNFGSCTNGHVHDISFSEAGFFGVYLAGCSTFTVERVAVTAYANSAITVESDSRNVKVSNCIILAPGTGHAIAVDTGSSNEVSDCFVYRAGPGCFCIAIGSSDSIVARNRVTTNTLEGINLQDASRVSILDNIVYCEVGHVDFGISIYAANDPVESCIVSGNRVYNSGSSGIGVASTNFAGAFCRYNRVSDNLILNPVQNAASIPALGKGGINLYGPQTTHNTIQGNTIIDQVSNMLYGVNEWDDSLGAPTYNHFIDNDIPLAAGLLEASHRLGVTTKVWDLEYRSYTPTIFSTGGAITSYTINACKFRPRGDYCEYSADITITNNGTGSGLLAVNLPTGWGGVTNGGTAAGKEVVTGGYAITGEFVAATMNVQKYDAAYPGTTNSRFVLSGSYRLA